MNTTQQPKTGPDTADRRRRGTTRTARRVLTAVTFAALRGAATTAGGATATWLVWWLSHH